MADIVSSVHHRPLMDSEAPEVRRLALRGQQQVHHGSLLLDVVVTQGAQVVPDEAVCYPIAWWLEAFPTLRRVA
jgi:hypothetical protein